MGTTLPATGRTFLIVKEVMDRFVKPQPGEQVFILADTESDLDTIQAISSATHMHKAEPVIMIMPPTFLEGVERDMPSMALKALEEADVYFPMTATTGHSVHVKEIAAALYDKKRKRNIRCFVFAAFYGAGLASTLHALRFHDYNKVIEWGKKFEEYFNTGKQVHVTSEAGSDFTASIENIPYRGISAVVTESGQVGGINVGECYGGPVEYTGEGNIVVDGPIMAVVEGKPYLSQPVTVKVEAGRVTDVKGGEEATLFRQLIESIKGADVLAEVSVGTNPFLRPNGDIRGNDKWVLGTMHVAFGQNTFQIYPYGTNECSIHIDALMTKPSCWIDDKQILRNGVPLV